MKYRFACPDCGHGQESSFVRLGAQVRCPSCQGRFRIEAELLKSATGGSLSPTPVDRPENGQELELLEDGEPDALVGLSGLSGLMHEAEELLGKGGASDSLFPRRGQGGSFRAAAEAGLGVDPVSGSSLLEETPPQPLPPPRPPVEAPPTRDQLRRQRQGERAAEAERALQRRRLVLLGALAVGVAVALGLAVWIFSGGSQPSTGGSFEAEAEPERPVLAENAAGPSIENVSLASDPAAEARTLYARATTAQAGEAVAGARAEASAVTDLLGQTRRLDVVVTAGPLEVPGPLTLSIRAEGAASSRWEVALPGGLAAGQSREASVFLVPPLATAPPSWVVTLTR